MAHDVKSAFSKQQNLTTGILYCQSGNISEPTAELQATFIPLRIISINYKQQWILIGSLNNARKAAHGTHINSTHTYMICNF
jgi:hypothetical protein